VFGSEDEEERRRDSRFIVWKLLPFYLPYLIRSNFIKTTYDISLDSQISFLPLGFSPTEALFELEKRIQSKGKKVNLNFSLRSHVTSSSKIHSATLLSHWQNGILNRKRKGLTCDPKLR